MEEDRGPIYQWLSTVQEQDRRGHRNTAEKKQQGAGAAVMTGIPLIPLESPGALRGIRRSTGKKRSVGHLDQSRTSPTPQSPTRDEGRSKRARHNYERQPRHKTRDDHYEYKAPSAAGSRPHACKGRAKNGRGRKHTLNDFQAVNVTGNRLTIPNQANLGIFNKGKTSSAAEHPTNRPSIDISRDVHRKRPKRNAAESDLAFSEMNFLSRRKNISPEPTLEAPEHTPCVQHAKRSQLNTLLYSHSKDVSKNALVQASKSFLGLREQVDVSPTPLSSFAVASPNKIPLGSKHSLCASPSIRLGKGEVSENSSSPPYPWPESKAHDTLNDLPLQQYLLKLLHTDLDPKTISGVASDKLATFRHWSLSELWVLLEERKASWSTETDNKQQSSPRPKSRDEGSVEQALHSFPKIITPPQLGFVCADTNERLQAYPNPRDAPEPSCGVHSDSFELRHSVLEEKKTDQHQTQEQYALDFSLQAIDDRKTSDVLMENRLSLPLALELTNEHLCTFSQDGLSTNAPVFDLDKLYRVADDDLFYETLDAAYYSILHPEAAGQEFVPDELELPILFGSSRFNEPVDLLGSPKSAQRRSSAIPVQVVKTEQIPHPPLAQNIKQDRVGTGLLGVNHRDELPQNDRDFDQNRFLPWLTGYNIPQSHVPTSRTLDRDQGPALFGFWRQNKLY
ncbi:hypothetical protein N7485_010674 [Penicillium canescens]|nr:hypothetical protein N7485_010674 [Penicillium canescens]